MREIVTVKAMLHILQTKKVMKQKFSEKG